MSTFTAQIIRDYVDLADALAALKNYRGLSNENLEELTGLTRGHVDKMLGPGRQKSIGKASLKYLLLALGGQLVLMRDLKQELLMRSRWEGRNEKQIRKHAHPMSITILRQASPLFFAKLSRQAALARLAKIPPVKRSLIARKAAKARWSKDHGPTTERHSARPSGTPQPAATAAQSVATRPGAVACGTPRPGRDRAVPPRHNDRPSCAASRRRV